MSRVKIIEVKSELGAGTRGSSLGVEAIKIASLDFNSKYFKDHESTVVKTENQLLHEPTLHPFAKKINGIVTMYERISKAVSETIKLNLIPVVLSADHSNAGGTIAGIKDAFPNDRIGIIWIDAHADLHSPYTTPTGHVHGMPLAASLGEDNLKNAVNKVDEETVNQWNLLKNIGGISPKIKPSDIVFITVRDVEKQEEYLIKRHNIKNFSVDDIRNKGIEKVAKESMIHLQKCDKIYVSFDVDSMDSSISKGTGTPVPDGISDKEAGQLISRLLESRKICCFEITEVNPTLDKENLMAENAFEILVKATNQLEQS